jgi:hypothetical protein
MIEKPLVTRLLCVALIAAIMLPVGRMIFPFLDGEISGMQFHALEAVISTTVGFGIYGVFG